MYNRKICYELHIKVKGHPSAVLQVFLFVLRFDGGKNGFMGHMGFWLQYHH